MPNWCENDLVVTGPDKDVRALASRVKGESAFDFCRIIPYPKRYADADRVAAEWEETQKKATVPESWDKRPKDGFNSGGYEWCCEHWGTKWNACDVRKVSLKKGRFSLSFDTAWGPPRPVIRKLSKMFPKVSVSVSFYERGMEFQGVYTCKAGKVVEDEERQYAGERGG